MEWNSRGNLFPMTHNFKMWIWNWSKHVESPRMINMEENLPWKMQKRLTGLPSQGSLCFSVGQQCPRAPTETAKTPNIVSPVNLNTASGCFASLYSIQTQQLTSCISLYRSDVLCTMCKETLGIQNSLTSLGSLFCSAHGQYGLFISICDKEEIFTDTYFDLQCCIDKDL